MIHELVENAELKTSIATLEYIVHHMSITAIIRPNTPKALREYMSMQTDALQREIDRLKSILAQRS